MNTAIREAAAGSRWLRARFCGQTTRTTGDSSAGIPARIGSGVFETIVAILLLIPRTAGLGAGLIVVWMTAVILSHIFLLGYGWFFVDALMVMLLAVIYVVQTHKRGST